MNRDIHTEAAAPMLRQARHEVFVFGLILSLSKDEAVS
jgi:hypothetical protein